ncbi:MAG TPA: M20/M25/M40 family metallo-hydrolase [Solirubrobacteraceae bacterium]|nr:M20/M25/M40 family metallo-hydrolase [Solirubrobacteraceae bacterium]
MSIDAVHSRVGELERRYLNGTFAELCRIESPSGSERACAERVIAELRALDVAAHEDDAGPRAGSDCGNLLARIPGDPAARPDEPAARPAAKPGDSAAHAGERRSLLLCAHLDTVPLLAPVEPVLVEGFWENENEGVLGADNKAAVAVLLALARHVRSAGAPVDLELLFTVGEETALAGARAFDASLLQSGFGYVFDHATPIGEVVVDSPTHFRIEADFHGAAAHAGIRPEDGRSAILAAARAISSLQLGRLDEQTTVNVGTIAGGTAMNVVPERCTVVAEVRGMQDERAETVVAEVVQRLNEAANLPECECDVDVSVQRMFAGFHLIAARPAVRVAESALAACGYEPVRISSGGASDANELLVQGVEVVNLANGTERNHEPGERVSVAALEGMLDVALALLDAAADPALDTAR